MFKCKECGKEFGDWHALGGHMRTHWERRGKETGEPKRVGAGGGERAAEALGRLGELSPQEAWQIVVNWIIDVHQQMRAKDELIQSYRLRLQDSEARAQAIQGDLKRLRNAMEESKEAGGHS
jgi:hypothetical protein